MLSICRYKDESSRLGRRGTGGLSLFRCTTEAEGTGVTYELFLFIGIENIDDQRVEIWIIGGGNPVTGEGDNVPWRR